MTNTIRTYTNVRTTACSQCATIYEKGNGFPVVGDYVAGDDGEVYRVLSLGSPITTNGPGQGNSIRGVVELADWADVTDDEEPVCTAVVESGN